MAEPLKGRLVSLDVFRGATIAGMILVNNAGDWSHVYDPLLHAEWHGWTFTDTVFPFFLWIVGVALTLSFAKRVERGDDRGRLLLHTLRRSALIFAVGIALNGFPYYNFATIRIPGVLQRIAVCYLIAATIYLYTSWRGQAAAIVACLAGYWALMTLVPVPGFGPGVLTDEGSFTSWVDRTLLAGHIYRPAKFYDPEGLVSTLPAIGTALFGVLTGHILRRRTAPAETAAWIFVSGAALMFAGQYLSHFFPINKKIWTPSYTVLMAGLAATTFATAYWIVDAVGWRRGTKPFVVFGMNAIAAYVASGLLARLLGLVKIGDVSLQRAIFTTVFAPLGTPHFASLLYALTFDALLLAFCWMLYRRGWFVRL